MNWPNFISACRVVLIPLFVYLLAYGYRREAFLVFLVAGLSDALDGFLARILRQKSILGTFLDPVADKLLAATAFVVCTMYGMIPVWLAIIVISRDIIISLGALVTYLVTGSLEIAPRMLGKITTFFQFLTVAAALAVPLLSIPAEGMAVLFWATAMFTAASGLLYIWAGIEAVGSEV